MALFTVVLEYGGGTYIAQVQAKSAEAGVAKWVHSDSTLGVHGLGPAGRRALAKAVASKQVGELVQLDGLKNAWCIATLVHGKLALVNVIATAA